jgi:hypothetical protein
MTLTCYIAVHYTIFSPYAEIGRLFCHSWGDLSKFTVPGTIQIVVLIVPGTVIL